jgi:threonine aldolase
MRQVGVLAAAGLLALETMRLRLADDHANARRLVQGLLPLRPHRALTPSARK